MRKFNKIHVIALPRCATVSMSDALGTLGISIAHLGRIHGESPEAHHDNERLIQMHRQIVADDFQLDILKECDGLADYPACIPQVMTALDERYPGSLFINLRRDGDLDGWLQSVEQQFVGLRLIKTGRSATPQDRVFAEAMADFRFMTFGLGEFDPGRYRQAYWRFQEFIDDYFSGRERDLLTIPNLGLLRNEGYQRLCSFLECEVIQAPFPRNNQHSIPPRRAFETALRQGKIVSKTGICLT